MEEEYVIYSEKGYWNVDKGKWTTNPFRATKFCSKPFVDGYAEALQETFGIKVNFERW